VREAETGRENKERHGEGERESGAGREGRGSGEEGFPAFSDSLSLSVYPPNHPLSPPPPHAPFSIAPFRCPPSFPFILFTPSLCFSDVASVCLKNGKKDREREKGWNGTDRGGGGREGRGGG